ncbi:MAG TPA: hypothetical protein PKE27_20880 [Povalibacter sp.]|uniref:hypothetical protein n=1 Tax=Povalibacter sp. TaxID=1962978 RepID=UPI002C417DA3|nr:hypothetical protein [Povalibacter sp.]HMN47045.1 hypothetical protein [Povalibacter sp.]
MHPEDLHRRLYVPDLLVNALNQRRDSPLLHFVDAIPQTAVGKPDKKALRAPYAK